MSLKQQIEDDLKTAMLAGDKTLVTTLRGLKSSILNVEVAKGSREQGLSDTEVIDVLTKQAKQRQESAEFFTQGGNPEKAEAELAEKGVIEKYLPEQVSEAEISAAIEKVIADTGAQGMQAMGQVIGAVKQQFGATADGSVIARLVKEKLA